MKDAKEFLGIMSFFIFIIGLMDFFAIKYSLSHIKMNGTTFTQIGMMEYVNPTDGKKLYLPMYEKGDK